jgi:hypothetical protein
MYMVVGDVLTEIGKIGLWLKTAGIIAILWIIFNGISFFYNTKKFKELNKIREDMNRMDKKLNKILNKIQKK